ncbi:MAG: DUF4258 domain-containing protein, partial [Nanoarchaeota archaeon]|nr:DUF4258 domain-containing protein [Nanoarchaeota archaeon]
LHLMKPLLFIPHAEKRRRQRGYTTHDIEQAINSPFQRKKRDDNRIEITSIINNRTITVIYEEEQNYLRIITVI